MTNCKLFIISAYAGIFSICLLLTSYAATAGTISPGVYRLLDHGSGQQGPFYGLRMDHLGETFSVELNGAQVLLTWDGGNTANISGTLNANTSGGNGGAGPIWSVNYDLTGVSAVGTQGFTATDGSGTLTDPNNNVTALTGEQDGSGFAFVFLADGHRIGGDSDTPVGRGWLLPPSSIDDWLVRAELIPEPASALLMLCGLAGGVVCRRR